MKKGGGKNKGSDFERQICKALSKWWTAERKDDVFIRSVTSGAWSTVRRRQAAQQTYGQSGDIAINDPEGQDLLDAFCFELKCGYGAWTFIEVIEGNYKPSVKKHIEQFIQQAEENASNSHALSPALILKRDRKQPIILITRRMFVHIEKWSTTDIPQHMTISFDCTSHVYVVMLLEAFFAWCLPEHIKKILKR